MVFLWCYVRILNEVFFWKYFFCIEFLKQKEINFYHKAINLLKFFIIHFFLKFFHFPNKNIFELYFIINLKENNSKHRNVYWRLSKNTKRYKINSKRVEDEATPNSTMDNFEKTIITIIDYSIENYIKSLTLTIIIIWLKKMLIKLMMEIIIMIINNNIIINNPENSNNNL